MQILKFGGASVNNVEAIKQLLHIIKSYNENIIIVISAMGKMTNAFEKLFETYFYKKSNLPEQFNEIKKFHFDILNDLFDSNNDFHEIDEVFKNIYELIQKKSSSNYDYEYDKIVSYGELLSTKIVSAYMNKSGKNNKWLHVGDCLKTDNVFRDANIDWNLTSRLMNETFTFNDTNIYITQGFIGKNSTNQTTTLGREGSDFTAAIIANVLNAEKVTIWKDVLGVYNSDPHKYDDAILLKKLSYQETIELSFFGAKVIHQKTLKPLQNKNIPLFVKSFIEPEAEGTKIYDFAKHIEPKVPNFIKKDNQVLISIMPKDFSFVAEENIAKVFSFLANYNIKVNLMQKSALKLSIVVDKSEQKFEKLINDLRVHFKVLYNENLCIHTIRHYSESQGLAPSETLTGGQIYLEQKSRGTVVFLTAE